MEYHDNIFEDVVEFCLDCEVPKLLGLTPVDIMKNLDYATYNRMKDIVIKRNQERYKHLNAVQTKLEKRQEEILNNTRGKKSNE